MRWEVEKIINVAKELLETGKTSASTGEQVAAAFVLNNMDLLPLDYGDIIEAWDRLGDWQPFVREVKEKYLDKYGLTYRFIER